MTSAQALSIIRAPKTMNAIVEAIINSQQLSATDKLREFIAKNIKEQSAVKDDSQLRGLIFAQLTGQAAKERLFFISHFKEGDAAIYPQTITFKLAQIIPLNITSQLLQWE